jgi:dynein heavy chain, axonemal
MPHSFALVNKASVKFKDVERRHNYTTPKTFLELIKLYKSLLKNKREGTMVNIDRLETGLTKLHKTQKDVDVLVEAAKRMAVQVQEKVISADAFAEKVGHEKVKVNAENEAAQIEKAKCEQIAVEVTEKQVSCEADLAAALPLVQQVRDAWRSYESSFLRQ